MSGMAEVLVAHQRQDSRSCLCGWAELGKSHPEHVAASLSAAGFGPVKESRAEAHKVKRFRGELKSLGKHLDSWESQGHTTVTIRFLRFWIAAALTN